MTKASSTSVGKWKQRVESVHMKMCEQKRSTLARNTRKTWNRNRIKLTIALNRENSVRCQADVVQLTTNPSGAIRHGSQTTDEAYIVDEVGLVQKLPIRQFPKADPIPKSFMWVVTPGNIMTEYETELHQNACMTDKVRRQEGGFMKMVNALIAYQIDDLENKTISKKKEKEKSSPSPDTGGASTSNAYRELAHVKENVSNSKKTFPLPEIFMAICQRFPQIGTPEELHNRYVRLMSRADPQRYPDCTPNIDGADAQSLSRKRTLRGYRKLFCRRCFQYNCNLHCSSTTKLGPNRSIRKRRIMDLDPFTNPCSRNCYLRFNGTSDKNEASVDDENFCSLKSLCVKNGEDEWTGSERSMFRALHKVFLNNYCAIAKALLTKTCQQVYDFARLVGIHKVTEKEYKPPAKRTKKNISLRRRNYECNPQNYSPCDHSGPCGKSCSCCQSNNYCEKFCNCSDDCQNRFTGCVCRGKCKTNKCCCIREQRECDPDLCQNCGAGHFELTEKTCKNVSMQRGQHKCLLIGQSGIHGWGIFLKDGAKRNDLISEYRGEKLLVNGIEAKRRYEMYEENVCNYMFDLNDKFCVDGTSMSNKIRFANHSDKPNCYAIPLMVNGEHRIGIYAKRNMVAGEEVLFDYGPKFKFENKV